MLEIYDQRATGDIKFYTAQLKDEKNHDIDQPALALLEHLESVSNIDLRYVLKMHLLNLIEEFYAFAYENNAARNEEEWT